MAIVLDDATSILSIQKQRRVHQDFPAVSELQRQGREYGISLWTTTQEPQLVLSAAQNVNVQVMGPLSSGSDAAHMCRNLGLDYEEAIRARDLEQGEAIIKIGTRPVGPMLGKLEQSKVNRKITVDEARKKSEQLRRKLLSNVRPRSKKLAEILRAERGIRKKKEDADSYLVKVYESQGLMICEIKEKYKFTIEKEKSLRKQTIGRGWIVEKEIQVPGRGHNPKILQVTKKGRERLAVPTERPSHEGKASAEHIFWQRRGKERLEKDGYRAELEKKMGASTIDVWGVRSDHHTVGMEIAMNSAYEVTNIKKGLDQVDRLVVACRSKKVMDNLRLKAIVELGSEAANKVEFKDVKNLYLPRRKTRRKNVRA